MTLKEKITKALKEEGVDPKAFLLVADCDGKVLSRAEGGGMQIVSCVAMLLNSNIPHATYITEAVEFTERYKAAKAATEPSMITSISRPATMTEPEYAPLLGHTVPAGCRQLADHELLQKGDLYLDTEIDHNRPNGVKLDVIPEHWAGDRVDDWTYLGAFFREV